MRKLLAILAVCTVVLGCDSRRRGITNAFPSELGKYALVSAEGVPLPIPALPRAPNETAEIIADTIALTSGGNVRRIQYVRTITIPAADSSISSIAVTGLYTITRDSIRLPVEFSYPSGRYVNGTLEMRDARGFLWLYKR